MWLVYGMWQLIFSFGWFSFSFSEFLLQWWVLLVCDQLLNMQICLVSVIELCRQLLLIFGLFSMLLLIWIWVQLFLMQVQFRVLVEVENGVVVSRVVMIRILCMGIFVSFSLLVGLFLWLFVVILCCLLWILMKVL